MATILVFVAACSLLSAFTASRLSKLGAHKAVVITTSAVAPTVLLVVGLVVADIVARQEASADSDASFMSPLLFLLSGYPIIPVNFVANLVAAIKT